MAFFLAGLWGFALVALSEAWVMLPIGAVCVVAAWYYTGGRRPYGYSGLGEVFVFVFFGLVATLGTLYTQAGVLTVVGVLGSVGVGALASRGARGQQPARHPVRRRRPGSGRWRFGSGTVARGSCMRAWWPVSVVVVVACALLGSWFALLALPAYVFLWPALTALRSGAVGRDLIPVLARTGQFQLIVVRAAGGRPSPPPPPLTPGSPGLPASNPG